MLKNLKLSLLVFLCSFCSRIEKYNMLSEENNKDDGNKKLNPKKNKDSKKNNQNIKLWSCETCTFNNKSESLVCEICNEAKCKITWVCKKCTLINQITNSICVACDAEMPDLKKNFKKDKKKHQGKAVKELKEIIILEEKQEDIKKIENDDEWIEKLKLSENKKPIGPYFSNKKVSLKKIYSQAEIGKLQIFKNLIIPKVVTQTGCSLLAYNIFSIYLGKKIDSVECIKRFFYTKNTIQKTTKTILDSINKNNFTHLSLNRDAWVLEALKSQLLPIMKSSGLEDSFKNSLKSNSSEKFFENFVLDFFSLNGLPPSSFAENYNLKHVVIAKTKNLHKFIKNQLNNNNPVIINCSNGDHYVTIVGYDSHKDEYIYINNDKKEYRKSSEDLEEFAKIRKAFTAKGIEQLVGDDELANKLFNLAKKIVLPMLIKNYDSEKHFHLFANEMILPQYRAGKKGDFVLLVSKDI